MRETVESHALPVEGVKGYNLKSNVFLSLNIDFVFVNSADPDEMPHEAAFHLGLHCLP